MQTEQVTFWAATRYHLIVWEGSGRLLHPFSFNFLFDHLCFGRTNNIAPETVAKAGVPTLTRVDRRYNNQFQGPIAVVRCDGDDGGIT